MPDRSKPMPTTQESQNIAIKNGLNLSIRSFYMHRATASIDLYIDIYIDTRGLMGS